MQATKNADKDCGSRPEVKSIDCLWCYSKVEKKRLGEHLIDPQKLNIIGQTFSDDAASCFHSEHKGIHESELL